jgi:hypothetical protein
MMSLTNDLKRFLLDEFEQGALPQHPAHLFPSPFLEHLAAFIAARISPDRCPRCDDVLEGLDRHLAVFGVWLRSLHGGDR